jgi:hypothetical protein
MRHPPTAVLLAAIPDHVWVFMTCLAENDAAR